VRKRTYIGDLMADMHKELPCLIANVSKPFRPFYQGQRLYLATPHEIEAETCEVRYRDRVTGKLHGDGFPWSNMREVRVAIVPGHIAARCWRGTPEEMDELVRKITERYCPRIDDFSPDVDV
jgi:hypothetical protein